MPYPKTFDHDENEALKPPEEKPPDLESLSTTSSDDLPETAFKTTKIRMKIALRRKGGDFDVAANAKCILIRISKYAPELRLHALESRGRTLENLATTFPTTNEKFDLYFTHFEQSAPGQGRKMVICATISTLTSIKDIKFRNNETNGMVQNEQSIPRN